MATPVEAHPNRAGSWTAVVFKSGSCVRGVFFGDMSCTPFSARMFFCIYFGIVFCNLGVGKRLFCIFSCNLGVGKNGPRRRVVIFCARLSGTGRAR